MDTVESCTPNCTVITSKDEQSNYNDTIIPKEVVTRMRLDHNVQKVQELLDQKVPLSTIAKQFGCNRKTLRSLIKHKDLEVRDVKFGAPRRSTAHSLENVEKIRILYNSGYGLNAIAKKIGCSIDTLYTVLKENNIGPYKI